MFITVVTRNPDQVPAYLYDGVEILRTYDRASRDSQALILEVKGLDHRYRAEYQAGRLNSGLHASKVHETLEEAEAWLRDTFGVSA